VIDLVTPDTARQIAGAYRVGHNGAEDDDADAGDLGSARDIVQDALEPARGGLADHTRITHVCHTSPPPRWDRHCHPLPPRMIRDPVARQ
jgi:hypothetical protein